MSVSVTPQPIVPQVMQSSAAPPAAAATEKRGWRTWPWGTIIFLHLIFLAANVSPDNIPFPTEEAASLDRIVEASDTGQIGRRIAFIILGVVAIYGLWAIDRYRLKIRGALGVLLLTFFAISCMSLGWAEDVPLATRKIMIFVLLWAGAGWTAARFSLKNLLRFGFISNILTLLTCLGVEVGFGRFRPWVGGYRFAGIYHPNETGECLVVAMLAGTALAVASTRWRSTVQYGGAAAISFLFLLMTGSRTSLGGAGCAIAAYWVILSFGNKRAARALLIAVGVGTVIFCIGYVLSGSDLMSNIMHAVKLGRDDSDLSTLTERTPLWHALIDHYISARPLLGYGYGAFWSTPHLVAMSLLQKGTVYFHSHSGYLEMTLSIGLIGASIHVLTLLLGVKGLIQEYLSTLDQGAVFGAALLVTLMVSMFTEPTNMSAYLMPTFLDMAFLMHVGFIVPRQHVGVLRATVPAQSQYPMAVSL